MEWRKTSLHCRRRRLHGRSVVRRRRGLDAGRRGRGARGRVSGRKVVMAQWVAVERLLGASPKLLQLLTRALNLGRQEELQHGAQIGIPLRIIDILFFGATRSRPLSCPSVRPVRSINMHYPLHTLFTASLPSLPPTRPLHTHPVTHSLTHRLLFERKPRRVLSRRRGLIFIRRRRRPGAVGLASAVSDSCQHIVFTGHCRRPDGDADVFRATDGRAEAVHCFLNVLSSI